MLRSNSKSLGNHVVSPDEEKERLQWEGFAEKEGCKSCMKERVGDGKLIIRPKHTDSAYVQCRARPQGVEESHCRKT